MSQFQCPTCGASIAEDSAMCVTCKSGLRWQNRQPNAAMQKKAGSVISVLLFLVLATLTFILLLVFGSTG
jgi:uncharacterized membrane protein YvbJ